MPSLVTDHPKPPRRNETNDEGADDACQEPTIPEQTENQLPDQVKPAPMGDPPSRFPDHLNQVLFLFRTNAGGIVHITTCHKVFSMSSVTTSHNTVVKF